MVVLSGTTAGGLSLSYDGNVSASTTTNNVLAVSVSITGDTQLVSTNSNNIDVFLCQGNASNQEVILPINNTLSNYVINIINTSDTFPLRIRTIKSGDEGYTAELNSHIYSWSYPPYDNTGNILLDDNDEYSDNTKTQSNFILPPKRAVRLRYILDNDEIYFYEV